MHLRPGKPPHPLVCGIARNGSWQPREAAYSGAMAELPRYAIYYTAAQGGALDRFGASPARLRRPMAATTYPFRMGSHRTGASQTLDPQETRLSRHAEGPDRALADGKARGARRYGVPCSPIWPGLCR